MVARSSLLRRPTPGARPARRTSSVVAALAALAPRLVRLAHHGYSDRLLVAGLLAALERAVAVRGTHPFILHAGRRVTYAEFDRLANRAAHVLRGLGVGKGDRVTLAMGNSVEYLVAAFGVLKAGAVLNPVNPALGTRELDYILGHAEPRVVITDATGIAAPCPIVGREDLTRLLTGSPETPPA